MTQKRILTLILLCCLVLACFPARADEMEIKPREVWVNPDFTDGSFRRLETPQAQEVAVMMDGAIRTTAEAVQKAQAVFADPALGFEATDDSVWAAWPETQSHFNRVDWKVRAERGEEAVSLNMAMDGSGVWSVCMETDPFFLKALLEEQEPMDNLDADPCDMDALIRFCLDFAEKMEPGETRYFWSLKYYGFVTDENVMYALLEAPYSEEHETSKSFVVAIQDGSFRIVDYYSGNG